MLENVPARTKGFVLLREQNRATFVRWKSVARFLLLRPAKLVAWGGIEPPTQGFSKNVFAKSPLFASTYSAFVLFQTDRVTAKPHKTVTRFQLT